jgi:hypothetical protein
MQPEQAPPPDYNFILQDKPQPKKSLLPGAPKALVYGAGAVIVILIFILFFGLLFGKKNTGSADMMEAIGRSQEISRVTEAQSQKLKDPTTLSVASTTQASMTSEQSEMSSWLAKRKIKAEPKKLAIYKIAPPTTRCSRPPKTITLIAPTGPTCKRLWLTMPPH